MNVESYLLPWKPEFFQPGPKPNKPFPHQNDAIDTIVCSWPAGCGDTYVCKCEQTHGRTNGRTPARVPSY